MLDGAASCSRSSTVMMFEKSLSPPPWSTAVTAYCRCGTPLSWNVLELVSPRSRNEPDVLAREYTR